MLTKFVYTPFEHYQCLPNFYLISMVLKPKTATLRRSKSIFGWRGMLKTTLHVVKNSRSAGTFEKSKVHILILLIGK